MKKIAKLFALVALMCVPVLSFAQTNKEISDEYTDLAVVPREKPHTGAAAREQPRDSPVIER